MSIRWNQAAKPAAIIENATHKSASDIIDLFRKFDAEPGQYQEIIKDKNADISQARWPMLARMSIAQASNAPAVVQTPPAFQAHQPLPVPMPQRVPQHSSNLPIAHKAPAIQAAPLAAVFKRLVKTPSTAAAAAPASLFMRFRSL